MTTTEQLVSTGSLMVQGLKPGMQNGMSAVSGLEPNMIFVRHDPSGVLMSITGSDIAYDVSTGSFLIGDIVNGAGGLGWHALQTA